jgi:hypothetical protein
VKLKEVKAKEAADRQAKHDALTLAQKIAKLDARLGKGKGARRERANLTNG